MELKDLILQALDEVENGAAHDNATQNLPKKDSAENSEQTSDNEISLNARLSENLNALKDNLNASNELESKEVKESSLASSNATNSTNPTRLSKDLAKPLLKIQSSKTTSGKVIAPQDAVFSPSNIEFLEMLREKLLVLFEGLKMPQMQDSKEKLDLVVNFLQYELCLLDDFLKSNKK
ncbi:CiaD-like domain-containing protein [Helicobacter sp. T3_23-1056]